MSCAAVMPPGQRTQAAAAAKYLLLCDCSCTSAGPAMNGKHCPKSAASYTAADDVIPLVAAVTAADLLFLTL